MGRIVTKIKYKEDPVGMVLMLKERYILKIIPFVIILVFIMITEIYYLAGMQRMIKI